MSFLVGLIGSGISTSLTRHLHEREGARQGLPYVYRNIDLDVVSSDALTLIAQARELGFDALNITHPAKQIVLPAMDELSADARTLGAVNTVLFQDGRMIGHNTDHSGFETGLRGVLPDPDLSSVVLLGTGGAGSAIAYALLRMGTETLSVFDPVRERALAIRDALGPVFPSARVVALSASELPATIASASGLVNATPVGMVGHPGAPVDLSLLHPGLWVADAIYRPVDTELIVAARALGCPVVDGGNMAVGQAVDAFELITGRPAAAAAMRAHFAELTG